MTKYEYRPRIFVCTCYLEGRRDRLVRVVGAKSDTRSVVVFYEDTGVWGLVPLTVHYAALRSPLPEEVDRLSTAYQKMN